jgi:hypothetical protein
MARSHIHDSVRYFAVHPIFLRRGASDQGQRRCGQVADADIVSANGRATTMFGTSQNNNSRIPRFHLRTDVQNRLDCNSVSTKLIERF